MVMTLEPIAPEPKPVEQKQGKVRQSVSKAGHEISKEEKLTPEELKIKEAEEEIIRRSSESSRLEKSLSPGDVQREPPREKSIALPKQVFSPGPKSPIHSPSPAAATPKPSSIGLRSPAVVRASPLIERASVGEELAVIEERPLSPAVSPSEAFVTPLATRSDAQLAGELLRLRSKLTDLLAQEEVVDAIVKSWPAEWRTWAQPVTVKGQEAYRQLHHLKGVKVHKDESSGQMVIDIALPEVARGRHRQGKSMARVMEDGRVFMFFRFKGPKTPEEVASMADQFQAQERLKEAWVRSGGDPSNDPLSPYLIEGRMEQNHVGKTGEVVTRYVFEKADGSLYKLLFDENDDSFPQDVLERNRPLALHLCLDIAKALNHMHSRGLVHKDIQPKNILYIGQQGKITDFDTLSRSGAPFVRGGTVAYMPPECAQEPPPQTDDPSLDMFAYGVMLANVLDPNIGSDLQDICILSTPEAMAMETRPPDQIPPEDETGYEPTLGRLLAMQGDLQTLPEPWPFVSRLIDPHPERRPTAAETATYIERFLASSGH